MTAKKQKKKKERKNALIPTYLNLCIYTDTQVLKM